MRLSDQEIFKELAAGTLSILPAPRPEFISGVSVDLTLGSYFRTFLPENQPGLDLGEDRNRLQHSVSRLMSKEVYFDSNRSFFLQPGALVIAVTQEELHLPDYLVGWLDGRSSLARLGLMIHVTAHRVDPGWKGKIVLECQNVGPVALGLRPGMRIGALSFEMISGEVLLPYGKRRDAKYRFQTGPAASALAQDT